jgi:hypothetical protein
MRYIFTLLLLATVVIVGHTPREARAMPLNQNSPAVAVARAHVEAWSHHNWDKAQKALATDVHVTVTTTQSGMAATDTIGIDAYMAGLKKFAGAAVPGSAHIIASAGDERNALLMLTVTAAFGPGGAKVPLTAARLYLLDDHSKIKTEQVVFFVSR